MKLIYKIGDFSNLVNISVRTLRYYDEINLLKPEIVDDFTSYRYYSENNIVEAKFIILLKDLGFTLQEIIEYKESNDEDAGQLLIKKQTQINTEIENLQKNYNKITALRKNLKGKIIKKEIK